MLITTNTWKNASLFKDLDRARLVVQSLYNTRSLYPFRLFGFVVMYDHCHVLLYIDHPITTARIMHTWKSYVSHALGLGRIWQSRYHIRIVKNPNGALTYLHKNPVVAGYCKTPESYQWSSASGLWDVDPLPQ